MNLMIMKIIMNKQITIDGIEYNLVSVNKEEIKSDIIEEIKLNGWESRDPWEDDSYEMNINHIFSTVDKRDEMKNKIKLLLDISKWRDENDSNYGGETYGHAILVEQGAMHVGEIDTLSVIDIIFTNHFLAEQALEIFMDDIKKVWGIK